ncbi:hypothetical protein EVAR_20606_1 [Eumeta japonica]|uniref:Uncharacterized protein n=1 Tax=Eumeta variegata TaxID=151549 RepID=A0A4C1URY8_EUMVA|nr:hypothetical protein EVAR_20606_1 [Eumeta japonica]
MTLDRDERRSNSLCCARGRPIIVEWERDARHSAGLSLVRSPIPADGEDGTRQPSDHNGGRRGAPPPGPARSNLERRLCPRRAATIGIKHQHGATARRMPALSHRRCRVGPLDARTPTLLSIVPLALPSDILFISQEQVTPPGLRVPACGAHPLLTPWCACMFLSPSKVLEKMWVSNTEKRRYRTSALIHS